MSKFLVIDSDGPRVEQDGYAGVARDLVAMDLAYMYLKHWRRVQIEELRYIDPEAK